MDVLKKHYETLTILGGMAAILVGCCMWINGKFSSVDDRFASIEQRLVRIETVLIMQGIMPKELAIKNEQPLENKG